MTYETFKEKRDQNIIIEIEKEKRWLNSEEAIKHRNLVASCKRRIKLLEKNLENSKNGIRDPWEMDCYRLAYKDAPNDKPVSCY